MDNREQQVVDEEALYAEYGGKDNEPEKDAAADDERTTVSDVDYARQVRAILDHPRFRALGRDEQALYLQLHRHCQGRGYARIRVSLAEMSTWVGRAGKNVRVTFRKLRDKRLVTVNQSAGRFRKGQYTVHPLVEVPGERLTALEMSNRIDRLTKVEQSTLDQQIATLEKSVLADLRRQAALLVQDLVAAGFDPLPSVEEQAFRYLAYVKTTGIWRIAQRFPKNSHE